MADVKISEISTTTSAVVDSHLFETETGAGVSEKTPALALKNYILGGGATEPALLTLLGGL
jgi:hypothetical protein